MASRAQLFASSLVIVVGLVGCGDNRDAADAMPAIDAPPVESACWLDTYTPSGTVALGTGRLQYEVMPDMIALEYGSQDGFDIPVNAEISGLMPGSETDTLDPNNPRTRFHGYFVDTGEAINPGRCGVRIGYAPSSPGATTYDMTLGSAILFDTSLTGVDLFGRQVNVVVEVIDAVGNYATDEKVVTCQPPPGWTM